MQYAPSTLTFRVSVRELPGDARRLTGSAKRERAGNPRIPGPSGRSATGSDDLSSGSNPCTATNLEPTVGPFRGPTVCENRLDSCGARSGPSIRLRLRHELHHRAAGVDQRR